MTEIATSVRIDRSRYEAWASTAGAWLARPRTSWQLAALAILVLLPTVWSGMALDDFFHRVVVQGKLGASDGRLNLFEFISSDPIRRARFEELGLYPWWTGPQTRLSYWRPLAAITHFVDYTLWPRAAWLMHVESLAWYGALIVASNKFYRRFVTVPRIAGLATACYAFDPSHAFPAAWIANRNALMSALFGVLSLCAHRRWRVEHRLALGAAASGLFALALLSAEAGLAIAGYIAAYALVFEGNARDRVLSLLPYAIVAIGWRLAYRALGHGVSDTEWSLDPLADPGAFLIRAVRACPILLASDVVAIPPDLLYRHVSWISAAAVGATVVLAIVGYAALPLFRRDRTNAFFAIGAALSVLPLAASVATDRYLFWPGLGIIGLSATLAAAVLSQRWWTLERPAAAAAAVCILVRLVFSPVAFPLRSAQPGLLEDDCEQMVATIPRGPGFAEQTVIILNAPAEILQLFVPILASEKGKPSPAHMYMLAAGTGDASISRTGARSLEMTGDFAWLAPLSGRAFRNSAIAIGETIRLDAMIARVESLTRDGRPERVLFSFAKDLDDASLVFLAWGAHGFERVTPQWATVHLRMDAESLFTAEVLRPHVRWRALEGAQLFDEQ